MCYCSHSKDLIPVLPEWIHAQDQNNLGLRKRWHYRFQRQARLQVVARQQEQLHILEKDA